jgi:predicted nucleic acid-binding protein
VKKRLYFDTSAFVKEFVPELGSQLISRIVTAATEGHIEVYCSEWVINEAVAVVDRLSRRINEHTKKPYLSKVKVQGIIATIAERVRNSGLQNSNIYFVYLDHAILANSRKLIDQYHISADDAVHLYTGWIYDCDYFLTHDKDLFKRIPSKNYEGIQMIDLGNAKDRNQLGSKLTFH